MTSRRIRSRSRSQDRELEGRPRHSPNELSPWDVIQQLPPAVRTCFEQHVAAGIFQHTDFDVSSLQTLCKQRIDTQLQVLSHLECQKDFLTHSRSKSGFLVAAVEKARTGCLDYRGFGAIDPWTLMLRAQAVPRPKIVDLVPEKNWLEFHGLDPVEVLFDTSESPVMGVATVSIKFFPTSSILELKTRLNQIGVPASANKIVLLHAVCGYLRNVRTLAYYNITKGDTIRVTVRRRGCPGCEI